MKLLHKGEDISPYIVNKIEISYEFKDSKLIGNTVSKEMKLSLDNYGREFKDLSGDFELSSDSYIFGVYHVYDAPQDTSEILKLTLYDNMLKLDQNYNSSLAYPVKLKDQLDEIIIISGITILYDNIPGYVLDKVVGWHDNTCTMRDHIGWIAELCGMNAMCTSDGNIIFYGLSTDSEFYSGVIETYKKKELCMISRICFDNGIIKFENGSHQYNTLYLSSDNLYIDDQIYIDAIYEKYNGLKFTSVENVKMSAIDELQLGNFIRFNSHFVFMPTAIKWMWEGGSYAIQTISGSMPSKSSEIVEQKISDAAKIRIIKTTVDQAASEMSILSKEIDDLNENYAQLTIKSDNIQTEVSKLGQSIYKFEAGSGNIFNNCAQSISKGKDDNTIVLSMDMPPYVDAEFLTGKDICISVDVEAINAIPISINGRAGAYFSVSYEDGTSDKFELWFIPGVFTVGSSFTMGQLDINKRIYRTFKITKKVINISNLYITIECNADFVYVGFPKVEIGKKPTGFAYDIQEVRDSVVTIEKQYSEINQQMDSLSLSVVSATEEISTIKGDITEQELRLQSAEIMLTPTSIVNAVNEKIGADGALVTSSTTLDKDGFHIKGKGFDVTNLENKKVFELDSNGNIVLNDITAKNGKFNGELVNYDGQNSTVIGNGMAHFFVNNKSTIQIVGKEISFHKSNGLVSSNIKSSDNVTEFNANGNALSFGFLNGGIHSSLLNISQALGVYINSKLYLGFPFYNAYIQPNGGDLRIHANNGSANVLYEGDTTRMISGYGSTTIYGDLSVTGNFSALNGRKDRVLNTRFGKISMGAVESSTSIFEDNGSGALDEHGELKIVFDAEFMEAVATNHQYFVSLTKCGNGDIYCYKKGNEYFIVRGTPNLEFDWCVKAKQKDSQLERFHRSDLVLTTQLKSSNINEKELSSYKEKKDSIILSQKKYYEEFLNKKTGGIYENN